MHSLCNKNQPGIFELTESECGIFARADLVREINPCEFSRSYRQVKPAHVDTTNCPLARVVQGRDERRHLRHEPLVLQHRCNLITSRQRENAPRDYHHLFEQCVKNIY